MHNGPVIRAARPGTVDLPWVAGGPLLEQADAGLGHADTDQDQAGGGEGDNHAEEPPIAGGPFNLAVQRVKGQRDPGQQ